jgi:diguanylate cyclase (GGDEF)-like protein
MASGNDERCALFHDVDPLTNLPWSLAAEIYLHDAAAAIRAGEAVAAVIAVDIDDFAGINVAHSEAAGDEVLRIVARRLAGDAGVHPFRIEADVFVLLVESIASRLDAVALAADLQSRLAQPCVVNGQIISFTGSVGIRLALDGNDDPGGFVADAVGEIRRTKRVAPGVLSIWTPQR